MLFELAPWTLAFQRHQVDGRYLLWNLLLATVHLMTTSYPKSSSPIHSPGDLHDDRQLGCPPDPIPAWRNSRAPTPPRHNGMCRVDVLPRWADGNNPAIIPSQPYFNLNVETSKVIHVPFIFPTPGSPHTILQSSIPAPRSHCQYASHRRVLASMPLPRPSSSRAWAIPYRKSENFWILPAATL